MLQYTVALWRRWKLIVAVFSVVVITGLSIQWTTGKLTHALSATSPFHARLQIWQVSLAFIRDHPLFGTGLGTFEPTYQQKLHELLALGVGGGEWGAVSSLLPTPDFLRPPLEWVVRDPHNVLLSFWLNTGLLGLLSMAGLVVVSLRRPYSPHPTPYSLAAQAALAAVLLFGLVDVPYFKNDLAMLWWAYLIVRRTPPDVVA